MTNLDYDTLGAAAVFALLFAYLWFVAIPDAVRLEGEDDAAAQ